MILLWSSYKSTSEEFDAPGFYVRHWERVTKTEPDIIHMQNTVDVCFFHASNALFPPPASVKGDVGLDPPLPRISARQPAELIWSGRRGPAEPACGGSPLSRVEVRLHLERNSSCTTESSSNQMKNKLYGTCLGEEIKKLLCIKQGLDRNSSGI